MSLQCTFENIIHARDRVSAMTKALRFRVSRPLMEVDFFYSLLWSDRCCYTSLSPKTLWPLIRKFVLVQLHGLSCEQSACIRLNIIFLFLFFPFLVYHYCCYHYYFNSVLILIYPILYAYRAVTVLPPTFAIWIEWQIFRVDEGKLNLSTIVTIGFDDQTYDHFIHNSRF